MQPWTSFSLHIKIITFNTTGYKLQLHGGGGGGRFVEFSEVAEFGLEIPGIGGNSSGFRQELPKWWDIGLEEKLLVILCYQLVVLGGPWSLWVTNSIVDNTLSVDLFPNRF